MLKVSIITIGDELLIGQVIDTNSSWMAQQLNLIGMPVIRKLSVGDDWDAIWNALDEESIHADIVLLTGGLGPTADDITKPLLCKYFGGKLVMNEEVLAHITYLFEHIFKRPMPMLERNAKQAELPDVCTVIHNTVGTAPGMQFEKNGKIFISMPGVPNEMKTMMSDRVLPMLAQNFFLPTIVHKTLVTFGIGESFLAERIKDWEAALPIYIKLAYLPNYGMVRLRLSAMGMEKALIESEVNAYFNGLKELVADGLVTDLDEPMETVLAKLLLKKSASVSTAESCTGGYIAHLITAHAGSSAYYKGSVVSYAYEAKIDLLQVKPITLQQHGAVSEATVQEMLVGVLKQLNTDYGIAVSGIMGPDGGMPGKPVGSVWVAVGSKTKMVTQLFQFRFDRQRNIELTSINALNLLRKFILENEFN